MAFLTIDEIKQQTYVSDSDEDSYLELLGNAAIAHIQDYTNRKLYEKDDESASDDEIALVWTDDIKIAALMLVAHYYENREATVTGSTSSEVKLGAYSILSRYKFIPV